MMLYMQKLTLKMKRRMNNEKENIFYNYNAGINA